MWLGIFTCYINYMYYVIAGLFGLVIGSFLNVVILRFDDWMSIVKTRSHCPHCKTELSWLDLIPVVSFICLRAKCRYCKKPISWQYPLVELTMGALMMAGYYLIFVTQFLLPYQQWLAIALYTFSMSSLIVIFAHDLKEMMIPDYVSYFFMICAFFLGWILTGSLVDTVLGGLVGFVPIALLVYPSKGRWMGEGDVKLAASLGLMTAYPQAAVFITSAFIFGGLFGGIGLMAKRVKMKSAVPFAPFLILGGVLALFYGYQLIDWYFGFLGYY